jgi:hypothetical protein
MLSGLIRLESERFKGARTLGTIAINIQDYCWVSGGGLFKID